ncbi:hypothetical protein HAX54_002156 [Datura stramonium]|uniref:Uncharacterized protein n=1 Tax=Datura stramonium TaxID=4076 RepID=A0ABS8T3H6_DATST|nr:hypothetical protein [Datura stramonium]
MPVRGFSVGKDPIPYGLFELQRFFDEHECAIWNGDSVYVISTFDFTTEFLGRWKGHQFQMITGDLMLRAGSLAAMSCSETAQPFTSCYDVWERIGDKKLDQNRYCESADNMALAYWHLGV